MNDAERINAGIAEADEQQKPISVEIARLVASQLHEGQWSSMYKFSSSGHISPDLAEQAEQDQRDERLDTEARRWAGALALHLVDHEDKAARKDWAAYMGDPELAEQSFEDAYVGHFPHEAALIEHLREQFDIDAMLDSLPVPDCFKSYVEFDGEQWLLDLNLGGELYMCEQPDNSIRAYWTR